METATPVVDAAVATPQTPFPQLSRMDYIPVGQIDFHPIARSHDAGCLASLGKRMTLEGQLQNIVVVPKPEGRFEVIAGVGRVTEARALGWDKILASVREGLSEFQKLQIMLSENEEREQESPVHKARVYKAMKEARTLSVRGLANEQGMDESDMTRYLNLADLPPEVQESLERSRLSMGHIKQILRLNDPNGQIAMSEQAAKKDLSVSQLKALVDQKPGNKTSKAKATAAKQPAEPVADPLSAVWPPLQTKEDFTPDVHWEVKYGPHELAPGHKVNGWFFFAMPTPGLEAQPAMAVWFKQMAQALAGAKADSVVPAVIQEQQAMRKSLMDNMKPRLPQNADEEAELQKIAESGGPVAVYEWIYGKGSFMAQAVPFKTWQEAGCSAADGLKQILGGIRQMEGLTAPAVTAAPPGEADSAFPGEAETAVPGEAEVAKQLVKDVAKNLLSNIF